MIKANIKKTETMLFTDGHDWHLDIFLEANSQITEISLKDFSHEFPNNIYGISWSLIVHGGRLQIPIDAAKINNSTINELVQLEYDITYYHNIV